MNESRASETTIYNTTQETQINTIIDDHADQHGPHLPSKQFKHFKLKQRLGGGGNGSVFLAHDNRLQRDVAIKMLTPGRSALNQALLAEARMQAKIEHPNICKIYQVSEADTDRSNSYLVMQYIPGKSALQWLEEQQNKINQQQMVTLMHKVCDGLQALHAQGIVHRDIKPANIMLADDKEDGIHPYMVDFGLADHNEVINSAQNKTMIAGTPAFMSPEQWQGAALDRRSDVYSFGATLYQLLTGSQPLSIKADPHPAKQFNSLEWQDLPADLKAIINKCMQPLREHRYQSARQVNEELLRYLTGEPVLSLPGKSYWLKKKLLKHKWPVLIVSLLVVGGITALIWQQYQQHQQQVREQLITTFTGRAESLERRVQLSKMAARHDIRAETAQWQQEIAAFDQEITTLGGAVYGPGHYAIGRMHFAMQQYDRALTNLQQAWDSGFQQTRVAYNLALSHGVIYQRQKAIINNISSASARKDKMALLDKQHRQPAIEYLERGISGSPYQSYATALLQYYQGEGDQALATLAQGNDLPGGFYQHHILRGDIYLAKAEAAAATNDDAQVQQYSKLALQHYAKATVQGRSDLQLQLKPLAVYFLLLNNSLYVKRQDFTGMYQQSMTLLDKAVTIAPDHYQAYFKKGQLLSKKSYYEDQHSGQPIATREQSIALFQLALTRSADNVDILLSLGVALSQNIKLLQDRAMPVESLFTSAINSFKRIPNKNRDYFFYNSYASLLYNLAINLAEQQQAMSFKKAQLLDVEQIDKPFRDAVNAYKQAIRLRPESIGAAANLGLVYRSWSRFVPPAMAQQKLKQSIEQYQGIHLPNPKYFAIYLHLAQSYNRLARINNVLLEPHYEELKQARIYLAKAEAAYPDHPFIVLEAVNLSVRQAIFDWQNGLPYSETLKQSKINMERILTKHANNATLLDGRAWLYRVEQQLNYFTSGAVVSDENAYHKALRMTKNIVSLKSEEYILLQLLHHDWHHIKLPDILALPVGEDSLLARALWYSQSGRFEQAEATFQLIQSYVPSVLWLYHHQHLQRWARVLHGQHTAKSQQQAIWLLDTIAHRRCQLQRAFPALGLTGSC